jgi:hypothetical protein
VCTLQIIEIGRVGAATGASSERRAPMHREANQPRAAGRARLERAVVLELLSDDGEQRRSLAQLREELSAGADELDAAVGALHAAGVLCREDGLTWAAPAARRLDELELIAI